MQADMLAASIASYQRVIVSLLGKARGACAAVVQEESDVIAESKQVLGLMISEICLGGGERSSINGLQRHAKLAVWLESHGKLDLESHRTTRISWYDIEYDGNHVMPVTIRFRVVVMKYPSTLLHMYVVGISPHTCIRK